MYRLNDLNKLKKGELLEIATSKGIKLKEKAVKASTVQALIDAGCVSRDNCQPPISLSNTIEFTASDLQYTKLTPTTLKQLPVVKFDSIYRFCCHDVGSFKTLDRAVKHNSAGDVIQIRTCLVRIVLAIILSTT